MDEGSTRRRRRLAIPRNAASDDFVFQANIALVLLLAASLTLNVRLGLRRRRTRFVFVSRQPEGFPAAPK